MRVMVSGMVMGMVMGMGSISSRSVKQVPQRTCLACRKVRAKREVIRIVRIPDGSVEIDAGGKKAGRGAYLCPEQKCWQIGLKGNRLERSLRATLTKENREELIRVGKDFLQE